MPSRPGRNGQERFEPSDALLEETVLRPRLRDVSRNEFIKRESEDVRDGGDDQHAGIARFIPFDAADGGLRNTDLLRELQLRE